VFFRVFLDFTGFYWVLLGFTGFYWVLPDFTGFYRILPDFTEFYWVLLGFHWLYWVLLVFYRGFTGFFLCFSGFSLILLGFNRFHWVSGLATCFQWKRSVLWLKSDGFNSACQRRNVSARDIVCQRHWSRRRKKNENRRKFQRRDDDEEKIWSTPIESIQRVCLFSFELFQFQFFYCIKSLDLLELYRQVMLTLKDGWMKNIYSWIYAFGRHHFNVLLSCLIALFLFVLFNAFDSFFFDDSITKLFVWPCLGTISISSVSLISSTW